MSVDGQQVQAGAGGEPMSTAVPGAPPEGTDMGSLLAKQMVAQLAPMAEAAARQVLAAHGSLIAQLRDDVSNLQGDVPAIAAKVDSAIASLPPQDVAMLKGVEDFAESPTGRWVVLLVLGAVLVACLAILGCYLAGIPQAAKIIAGVPVAVAGVALWLSRAGALSLPKVATPAPVAGATITTAARS